LRTDRLRIAVITDGGEEFRKKLLADEPSPMKYNSPKPEDLLKEDKTVESRKLGLKAANVRVVEVATVFE
jgi:zinc protease